MKKSIFITTIVLLFCCLFISCDEGMYGSWKGYYGDPYFNGITVYPYPLEAGKPFTLEFWCIEEHPVGEELPSHEGVYSLSTAGKEWESNSHEFENIVLPSAGCYYMKILTHYNDDRYKNGVYNFYLQVLPADSEEEDGE